MTTTNMGITNLNVCRRAVEYYMYKNLPVFIWGPPGVGKSDMVRQIRTSLSTKKQPWGMIDFRAILREPVDLRGVPVPDLEKRVTTWLTPDDLPNVDRDGEHGILFLDELNAANQDVQKACYGLVLDRKLGDYKLPDGWRVVAAGNRQSDRSSAVRMPKALANRFAHLEVAANAAIWIQDYAMEHCHESLVGFMRWKANMIHVQEVLDKEGLDIADERKFPTPRSWASVSEVADAPDDLLYTLVEGLVGQTAAAEYCGYRRLFSQLPDFNDILRRPDREPVPTEPSSLWMIATALGRRVDRSTFDAGLIYANRMGRDYEIVVAMDATKRDPSLAKSKAYIDFALRNKNVTIGTWSVQ